MEKNTTLTVSIEDFDISKLKLHSHLFRDVGLKKRLVFDNYHQFFMAIPKSDIKTHYPNKFNSNRKDYQFSQRVLNILNKIDDFVKSSLREPEKYKPLASKYFSAKLDKTNLDDFDKDNSTIFDLKEIKLNVGTEIWSFNNKIGITPAVDEIYEAKAKKQSIQRNQINNEDIFID